jgi:hypothetical protein
LIFFELIIKKSFIINAVFCLASPCLSGPRIRGQRFSYYQIDSK